MDQRWAEIDLEGLIARAAQAMFVLNERGALVFANPALHELFDVPLGNRIGWRELESGPLKPPVDLPPGGARQLDVQIREGSWVQIVFHALQDVHAGEIGVLGVVRPFDRAGAAPVSDANLFARWERLQEEQRQKFGFDLVPGRSAAGARLLHQLKIAATADTPVLFVGESGVGKMTLARVLHHQAGERGWSATLDAEALSPEQQREFLFGEGGVSTQSGPGQLIVRRPSMLASDVQQALADAHEAPQRSWRLLAADREPPDRERDEGRLNAALYFVLTRLVIHVPPLRERREDVAELVALLLRRRQAGASDEPPAPTASALEALERYDWPGNVRELATVVEAAADKGGDRLDVSELPPRVARGTTPPSRAELKRPPPLDQMLEQIERRMMRSAHAMFRGNKSKAAEHLGLSRARFIRRWEQLKMDEEAGDGAEE